MSKEELEFFNEFCDKHELDLFNVMAMIGSGVCSKAIFILKAYPDQCGEIELLKAIEADVARFFKINPISEMED